MQNKTLDLVAIGECLVEFAEGADGLFRQGYSGDVLNALSMASTLGLTTGLVSSVGDDPFEPGLRAILSSASIDQSASPTLSGRANGIYFVLRRGASKSFHFVRKDSAATRMFEQDASRIDALLQSSRFALFSSIPLAFVYDRAAMLAALRSCHDATRIAFDINYRSALWPRPDELRALIEELASVAEILLVSEEDDRALFGERSPDVALAHYAKMGYTRIVFRRGPLPTQALIDGRQLEVPAIPGISVVDATGAGDAFNAGLIAAQIAGRSWYDSIAYANAAAASVLGTPGGRAVGVTQLTIAELAKRIPTEAHA